MTPYSASKAGVVSLTRSAAQVLAPQRITSNCVCPGAVETPMWEQIDREWGALFGFLRVPAVDATNWRAEQALRPAVITRKVNGGGNRTTQGAATQQVLASVLRTARQRELDGIEVLATLLRAPHPIVSPDLFSRASPH